MSNQWRDNGHRAAQTLLVTVISYGPHSAPLAAAVTSCFHLPSVSSLRYVIELVKTHKAHEGFTTVRTENCVCQRCSCLTHISECNDTINYRFLFSLWHAVHPTLLLSHKRGWHMQHTSSCSSLPLLALVTINNHCFLLLSAFILGPELKTYTVII